MNLLCFIIGKNETIVETDVEKHEKIVDLLAYCVNLSIKVGRVNILSCGVIFPF